MQRSENTGEGDSPVEFIITMEPRILNDAWIRNLSMNTKKVGKTREEEDALLDKIFSDHPNLYRKLNYLEVGPGWFDLIYELSSKLETMILSMHGREDYYAEQVKEKYGELCVYMSVTTDLMDELIDEYCRKSAKTCEICGKEGKLNTNNNWRTVRCETCA